MARPAPNTVDDELVPRPIIKEEELSKMDDIARDAGWAIHDDDIVDYNQQLLFSDDESTPEEDARKDAKTSNKDEKRSNDRERERESERESNEREEHREDHRDKRNEPLPQRGPPEQPSRNWQPGRSSVNMDFRSPPVHGPVAPATHPLPHGGPGPASLDCPMPPVMRPVSHPGQGPGPHGVEDEDIWDERRRQQNVEVAMAIERAKQRKEEEEKRFQGTKQGAARKLQALEQKMKLAAEKEHHEESSTPGPDWEKDKDRDSRERDRSRTSSEGREEKGTREARDSRDIRDHRERDSDFRPISQIGERPAFMRGDRELTRNDRELPRNERDREIPRNERERDISRNERGRDIPRTERDRDISRNDRDREVSRNERDRDITRIERDRELPRSDRDREISRSERDRDMQRSERDRDIQRGEREREIPRSERERDIPRSDRERDIPRGERDRDIARSERDRDIARNERDREIPRSERDREIPRSEREREIPRSEREREIPRNERDREISRADRDREITRNERDREITRNERDREISRNDREIPRNDRDREIRGDRDREITRSDRDRDIGRNDRDRDIPRNGRERDIPCNERDRDGSRNEREVPRSERERELPRSERDRERDMRSERERERDIRNDRDRKPRDSRDRHDTRYLANLPPRFQRSGIDRSSGFYGGQGSQQVPPQPAVGSGPTQGPPSATQGVFPQGSASTQVFDPRWNPPHFPSGPLPAPGTVNSNIKSGYLLPRGRDGDASNPDRERERERERERNERDRERERELDDRERDKERPPSRDPRDRRDRHIGDIPERYRPNARERDVRSYPDNGINARKASGNYYEGPPEYGRSYSRGSQEYDRNEYGRGRERDADVDSRSSESRDRESRLGNREGRDRDGRHYDDRRDGELIDEVYDRHPPPQQAQFEDHKRETVSDLNRQENNNDWREKDKKFLEDREKLERRDADGRREREERPQRPDSRDSRTSRESRNSRDSVREERSVHENDHKHSISNREVTGSWVEDHYPDMKEEKKKDFFREERRDVRHPPGPITREKLEASELRSDSKRNLTPLKRSTSLNCNEKKQDVRKADIQAPLEKSDRKPNETDVWNRSSTTKPLERTTPENSASTITASAAGQARFSEQPSSKPWADQIPPDDNTAPPSAAVPEEKSIVPIDSIKKDVEKDVSNNVPAEAPEKVKNNPKEVELEVERQEEVKKEEITGPVEVEPKREKSSRSRSGGARGRSDGRASRQGSGSYAVYRGGAMSWGQQRERGRRGLHRPAPSRASNAGEYTQATESEQSGDEASAESSKEDASRSTAGQRRPERERESRRPPRSPKQGQKKLEKEEKSRESRRADGEKGFGNTDLHRYDKRSGGYDAVRNSGREGFAPVGEPSRRGRGGAFRRGSVGRRYGPPSSKSPFGQPQEDGKHPAGNDDPKNKNCDGAPDPSKEDIGGELVSNEDKNKLKLQALAAGVIGSGARQFGGGGKQTTQVPPRMQGKSETEPRDSSRSKSRRGGSSGRGPLQGRVDRSANIAGGTSVGAKQNSSDVAEDWETTSEHSEGEEHDDGNKSGRKTFPKRDGRRSRGSGNPRSSRGVTSNATSPNGRNVRPGNEQRSNGSTSNGFPSGSGQRVPNSSICGSSSAPQSNGRGPNSRNSNQALPLTSKVAGKETTASVNRMDDMKINDPGLVNQAINDLNMAKKNSRMEKDKTNPLDGIDLNNFASVVVVDDQPGVTLEEERFTFDDADNGFQEVRNKKKEARQKDEQKVQQPQQQQQQQQPQPQPQQQTQLQQPQSTSQASQQVQGVSQQPPLPQRSSGVRDKEGGRQKGNKQSSNSGSGQIPSPIPGSTQQIPTPIPQAPAPPNISQGLGGNIKTFDRPRPKLPPRLAKQRETSRIQKQQQQQQQQQQYVSVHNDVSEMNKINQSVSIFPIKDSPNPAPPPTVNAWDKPINAALRPNSPSANAGSSAIQISGTITNSAENCNLEVNEQAQSGASSQRSTPSGDKVSGKLGREVAEKTVLDGTSPPVQTIIFENTNYKSGPSELGMKAAKFSNHLKNSRIDKGRERKLGEDVEDVQLSFANKNSGPVPEMNKTSENKTEPIQMPIAFNKNEDSVDMKLDFTFDSELSQLTDDKKNKSMGLPRSMHLPQGVQSTISHGSTDELNFKIASVKKVWEAIPPGPPVIEHNEDGSVASTASSFTPTFGNPVDSGLEPSFPKVEGSSVAGDDGSALTPGEIVYSSGPQIQNNPNSYSGNVAVSAVPNMVKSDVPSTSSNVCKVKPQQQAVMSAGPSPIGHPGPLSPPPFNSSNTQQGHINYQPTLGGTAAPFGSISAIPSPPTVLSYSSQQIPSQGGLYGAFQLDGTQVRSGQALSQFSGFPPYGLNQGLAGQTSAFNQQSMYLPTAPHPPPSAAPDIYPSSLSQYRIPAAQGPFGQSQQLSSNPSTVLISSTSNSLMSASVKPSSQQIGAIGTKGGGPYQQSGLPSQPSQLYIQYDPSYLSGSQMVQRPGPVQSNVVPTIPHSSSFYSGSAGGQAGFYQATNSTLQQGPSGQPLHQTGSPYGLQGYSTQSGTATPVGLQGFSSQMPQYRGTSLPAHTFLKSGQHPTDHNAGSNGRTQLKSPSSSQQDVLASVSVFSSGPQIPSPKSRSSKQQGPQQQQQQQQQSPNQQQPSQQNQQQPPHHKFSPYQGMTASTQLAFPQSVRGQMSITVRSGVPTATQRYPQPIQRPVPFPGGGTQGANTMGGRHRPQHQQPSRQPANVNKPGNNQPYYSHGSNVKMESVSDGKPETAGENKITENVTVSGSSNTAPGSSKPVTSVASQPEHKISPAENGKEESAAPAAE
ncbi:hypothetical protein R5R35_008391 [Gryllus longicercus]|uniref:BAT2 N-terminal domain-containing protein n=1 Tax=Gryllus longicercus TaxID=2509291 RepID=A0AAN9Z7I1_9ORTH